jgi:quinol monooxygenase YgiN
MVIVTVVISPKADQSGEVDRLLKTFRDSLADSPPDGMQGLLVLRAESGELLVEGRWRDAAAHRAFRANPDGAQLFQQLAACCDRPPVTYYGIPDPSLSFDPDGGPAQR